MKTDTSEKGLESLIVEAMTGQTLPLAGTGGEVRERPATYGAGWILGDAREYEREYCLDLIQLRAFLKATQPAIAEAFDLDQDSPPRRKFLARLQGETSKRGVIDVLRHGLKHGPHHLDLFYGTPSAGNPLALNVTRRTASVSPGSSVTAGTRQNSRSTCAFSSTACLLPPLNLRTASPSRRSRTPSSSTSGTATRANGCSSSGAASFILP